MEITAKINIQESILGKSRVIDFDILKPSVNTLSWMTQFIGKIVQTKNKTEVHTSWLVFDGNKFWKDTTLEVIRYCSKYDRNFNIFKLEE